MSKNYTTAEVHTNDGTERISVCQKEKGGEANRRRKKTKDQKNGEHKIRFRQEESGIILEDSAAATGNPSVKSPMYPPFIFPENKEHQKKTQSR